MPLTPDANLWMHELLMLMNSLDVSDLLNKLLSLDVAHTVDTGDTVTI